MNEDKGVDRSDMCSKSKQISLSNDQNYNKERVSMPCCRRRLSVSVCLLAFLFHFKRVQT